MVGRKRTILTDLDGNLLRVRVHSAAESDARGLARVAAAAAVGHLTQRLRTVWADRGYQGQQTLLRGLWGHRTRLRIVQPPPGQRGFQVQQRRWRVERTFAWLVKQRRLRCDYERLPTTSEAFIYLTNVRLQLLNLARKRPLKTF